MGGVERRNVRLLTAILTVLALFLAACGGGTDRDAAVQDLVDAGFGRAEAEFGDVSRLEDDDVTEQELQQAADVFVDCSEDLAGAGGESPSEDTTDEATRAETAATETTANDPAPAPTAADIAATDESPASDSQESQTVPVAAGDDFTGAGLGGPGHWSWDQLCSLVADSSVQALFASSNPVTSKRGFDAATWSGCKWEDPDVEFDPAKSTPTFFTIENIDRDGSDPRTDIEQVVLAGLGPDDGAVFRDEFDPGKSALHVYLEDQILKVAYLVGTPGARELAELAGQRWIDAQQGGAPAPASGDASDSDETSSAEAGVDGDAPGEDPLFDALWVTCAAGDPDGCDWLFLSSPSGSAYEEFGSTCGDREFTNCTVLLGDTNGSFTPATAPPGTDSTLDSYWNSCAAGDAEACDLLYFDSPVRSDYEYFGQSCGGRGAYIDCVEGIAEYAG